MIANAQMTLARVRKQAMDLCRNNNDTIVLAIWHDAEAAYRNFCYAAALGYAAAMFQNKKAIDAAELILAARLRWSSVSFNF